MAPKVPQTLMPGNRMLVIKKSLLPLLLLCFCATQAYGQSNRTLRVGWQNRAPFAFSADGSSQNAKGLDVEILGAIMETIGWDFQFSKEELPRKRQLTQLKNGELDLIFGVFKKSERKSFGIHTNQYRSRSIGLFVRRGQVQRWAQITSILDLPRAKISIGVVRGYSYGSQANRLLEQMSGDVFATTKSEQTRMMLIHRRFDGYLAYLPDESIIINENDLDHKIQLHPMRTVHTGGIHFLLSKKSAGQACVDEINRGLQTIKANGRYDQIIKKYTLLYGIDTW
jgi:polar amino acid transport system substrate-binding protein